MPGGQLMGFLFGICSDCCQDEEEPCSPGTDSVLFCQYRCPAPSPSYVGVFRNEPLGCLPAFPQPAGYVGVEITACFGIGAEATVDAPSAYGVCDYEGAGGPIAGVTVTNGGSGYAVLGRVAPTLTASIAGGSGATVTLTLAQDKQDGCGEPVWSVASLSASGGSGYADNADVTFSVAVGDTVASAAEGKAFVGSTTPSPSGLTTDGGGTGAILSFTFTELPSDQWISRGYSGCSAPNDVPKRKTYALSDVTIINGGSGYQEFDQLDLTFASADDGSAVTKAFIDVDEGGVDENGAITAVFIAPDVFPLVRGPGGKYAGALTDSIEKAILLECQNKTGRYYRQDSSVPAIVANVTVSMTQSYPSGGYGADLTAVVDDDPASATFGQITAITVDDGGSGYLQPPAGCESPGERIYVTFGDGVGSLPLKCQGGEGLNSNPESQGDGFIPTGQNCTYFRALIEGCACGGNVYLTLFHYHFNCGWGNPQGLGGLGSNCLEGEENDCGGLYNLVPDPYGVELFYYRLESDEDGCLTGEFTLIKRRTSHFAVSDGAGGSGSITTTLTPPLPSQGLPSLSFMPP
jgi:hypothetical protein